MFHQPAAEGHPFRRIVVAADEKDLQLPLGQPAEEVIQQLHRFGRGDGAVVDVAADQNGVGALLIDDQEDLGEDVSLVLQHGEFIDPLAEVQVGEMEQLHGGASLGVYLSSLISL